MYKLLATLGISNSFLRLRVILPILYMAQMEILKPKTLHISLKGQGLAQLLAFS